MDDLARENLDKGTVRVGQEDEEASNK